MTRPSSSRRPFVWILIVSCAVGGLPLSSGPLSHGDLIISSDFTQSGGTLLVNPPGALIVTHTSNHPLLTFENNATSDGIEVMIIGNLDGHSGRLLVQGGSIVQTVGNGSVLGTYGSISAVRGNGYLGLNSGAQGLATISGTGSQWNHSRELHVGHAGTGELRVEAGGQVSNTHGYLGYESGGQGLAVIHGSGSHWSNSGSLFVGWLGSGELRIEQGALVSNQWGRIGQLAGSTGAVLVTGSGSQLSNSSFLTVGLVGTGSLTIEDGGSVTSAGTVDVAAQSGSEGYLIVRGPGSQLISGNWMNLSGNNAYGELRIESGGMVQNTVGVVGSGNTNNQTGSALAIVTGDGSQWHNSNTLLVGRFGAGELLIEQGGVVTSHGGSIGGSATNANTGGHVVVRGQGSQWINTDTLQVGAQAHATMSILDGGFVSSTATTIASGTGSIGEVLVQDAGSLWEISGPLDIGGAGQATVVIAEGAAMTSYDYALIGSGSQSLGSVTVKGTGSSWSHGGPLTVAYYGDGHLQVLNGANVSSGTSLVGEAEGSGWVEVADVDPVSGTGATWHVDGSLAVGGDLNGPMGQGAVAIYGGGTLHVANTLKIWETGSVSLQSGGTIQTHDLHLAPGTFDFGGGALVLTGTASHGFTVPTDGTLSGIGTVAGDLVNDGALSPGLSAGLFSIDGEFSQSAAGTLHIEIGGTSAGASHDALAIAGAAWLDGQLHVELIGGFKPNASDQFTIVTADSIQGVFANAPQVVNIGTGLFSITYTNQAVVLGNFVAIPEPASGWIVLAAAAVIAAGRRRNSP